MIGKKLWAFMILIFLFLFVPGFIGGWELISAMIEQNRSRCGDIICLYGFENLY